MSIEQLTTRIAAIDRLIEALRRELETAEFQGIGVYSLYERYDRERRERNYLCWQLNRLRLGVVEGEREWTSVN